MHRNESTQSRSAPHITGLVMGSFIVGIEAAFLLQVIGSTSFWGATEVVGLRTDENRERIAQLQLAIYALTAVYTLAQVGDQIRQERDTSDIAKRSSKFQKTPGLANGVTAFFSGFIDGAVRPAAAVYAIAHPSTSQEATALYDPLG